MKRTWPVILLLTFGVTAQASWLKSYSLPELFEEADLLVLGTVMESHSFWNEARDRIYTDYTIAIEQTVKGRTLDTVTVRLLGGVVDGRELVVSNNPHIRKGEQVLLFLRAYPMFHVVIGMKQGKWSVRDLNGVAHVFRGKAPGNQPKTEGEIPLSELLKKCERPQPNQGGTR